MSFILTTLYLITCAITLTAAEVYPISYCGSNLSEKSEKAFLHPLPPQDIQPSSFQASYDSRNIYFLITCQENHISDLKIDVQEDWGPVWKDDCVEIFLSLPENGYIQLAANPAGKRFYSIRKHPAGLTNPQNWTVKAGIDTNHYSLFFTIPFSLLKLPPPSPGKFIELRGNICRERRAAYNYELSAWQKTRNFHDTDQFGLFILGDVHQWKNNMILKHINHSPQNMKKLSLCKNTNSCLHQNFILLEKQYADLQELLNKNCTVNELNIFLKHITHFDQNLNNLFYKLKIEELFNEK